MTIRISFPKGCLLVSFNLRLEKCVWQAKFFSGKKIYWGKFLTGKSDKISRKIRHFLPMRYLKFDFPSRFFEKLNPKSHKYRSQTFIFEFLWTSSRQPFQQFQKTCRKSSLFITPSDFWSTTLMKLNSTMDLLGVLEILLGYYYR